MATLFGLMLLLAVVLIFGLQIWSEGVRNHSTRTQALHQTWTSDEEIDRGFPG